MHLIFISNLTALICCRYEPGFYVDKKCLKTWRSRVLNLLEGRKSNSKSTPIPNEDTPDPVAEEAEPPPQKLSRVSSKPETAKNHLSQIRECSVVVPRTKINKNILQRRRNSTVTVPLSKIRDCVVLCNRLEVGLHKPNGNHLCKQLKVKLRNLTVSPRKSRFVRNLRGNSNKLKKINNNLDELNSKNVNNEEVALSCKDKSDNFLTCNSGEKSEKYEDEENKSDDGEDLSKAFNEGAICTHGKMFDLGLIYYKVNSKTITNLKMFLMRGYRCVLVSRRAFAET